MAYENHQLSALTYANGFTLWHYRTGDSSAVVDTAGYFDDAVKMLRTGDFILTNTSLGTNPASGVIVVASNDGTTVDVSNLSPLGVLNSD